MLMRSNSSKVEKVPWCEFSPNKLVLMTTSAQQFLPNRPIRWNSKKCSRAQRENQWTDEQTQFNCDFLYLIFALGRSGSVGIGMCFLIWWNDYLLAASVSSARLLDSGVSLRMLSCLLCAAGNKSPLSRDSFLSAQQWTQPINFPPRLAPMKMLACVHSSRVES